MSAFLLPFKIDPSPLQLQVGSRIFIVGSCFSEHMSSRLAKLKFAVCDNPQGILFNPISITQCLQRCMSSQNYDESDLVFINELFASWDFHSHFSHPDKIEAMKGMNNSVNRAHHFLKTANTLIITLGSAFSYTLKKTGQTVANNHKAPSDWLSKTLNVASAIASHMQDCLDALKIFNPQLSVIFTLSPVRHARDGVIENNRSKAQLIEAVHSICEKNNHCFYFPAYELVIDVLRDYRFYDIDLVHPNYAATQYVWEKFAETYFSPVCRSFAEKMHPISLALNHRPRFPQTEAHRDFLKLTSKKVDQLKMDFPHLNWEKETQFFQQELAKNL